MNPTNIDRLWWEGRSAKDPFDFHGGLCGKAEIAPYYQHKWEDPKWQIRYLEKAKQFSEWSKDATKIGAICVTENGSVIAQGYNGFPRGIYDDPEMLSVRGGRKLDYMNHAEMSCIFNASYEGISLKNTVMAVSGLSPCKECAKAIVSVGIIGVITTNRETPERWRENMEIADEIFKKKGVWVKKIEL